MTTSRSKQYPRIVVERRPTSGGSQSPPSSPKEVRFAQSSSGLVTGVSRQLTSTEHWSLYHFETHALACSTCHDPLRVYLSGGRLCDTGHALAQDVAEHVYHQAGEIYSTTREKQKAVRVELPPGYDQTRGLLKGLERHLRSSRPIVSYDRSYPVSPRPTSREPEYNNGRREVVIEPADSRRPQDSTRRKDSSSRRESSGSKEASGRRSKHKPTRYNTTVVQERETEPEPSSSRQPERTERRGSLYAEDQERKQRVYKVETREPKWERQKEDNRRDSGYHR